METVQAPKDEYVIKSNLTGDYVDQHDRWTIDEGRAKRFPSMEAAAEYAVGRDFSNFRVINVLDL